MSAGVGRYLFDTNIIVYLVRGGPLGSKIKSQLGLAQNPSAPMLSVITLGEIHKHVLAWKWGEQKIATLNALLSEFTVVDVNSPAVIATYGAIHADLESRGLVLEQNDMWIASCASTISAQLVSSDRNFSDLDPKFITHIWIDPKQK